MIDNLIYILVVTIIIFLVILAIINKNFQESRLDFMTDKEKRLFDLLNEAFPEMHIFPHVSCITIIEPSNHIKNIKKKKKLMKNLSHQFFLFSIFDKQNMEFVCAVEFATNDKEIMRNDGEKLQNLIEDAQIKTLRVSPFGFVDKEILRQQLSRLVEINLSPLNTWEDNNHKAKIIESEETPTEPVEIIKPAESKISNKTSSQVDVENEEKNIVTNSALDILYQPNEPKEPYWKKHK